MLFNLSIPVLLKSVQHVWFSIKQSKTVCYNLQISKIVCVVRCFPICMWITSTDTHATFDTYSFLCSSVFKFIISDLQYLPELSVEGEKAFCDRLIFEAKVLFRPGYVFCCREPGWFRIIFAESRDIVCEGLCSARSTVVPL